MIVPLYTPNNMIYGAKTLWQEVGARMVRAFGT